MHYLMAKLFNYLSLKASLILLFVCFTTLGFSQEVETEEFPDLYSDFSVDHLGNLYTLFENDILTKLVEKDEFEIVDYNYSNRALGDIKNFDVTNPLRIIVNHESSANLVFLDVTLSETARISLPDLQIFSNPIAYCLANDNTVWIYDDTNLEFIRVNEEGLREFTSQNLIQQLGFTPQISELTANKDYLIAKDIDKGLLVFDSYGTFLKRIVGDEIELYQLLAETILIARENEIIQIPLSGIGEEKVADLPEGTKKFLIQKKKLYFLTSIGVGEMVLE